MTSPQPQEPEPVHTGPVLQLSWSDDDNAAAAVVTKKDGTQTELKTSRFSTAAVRGESLSSFDTDLKLPLDQSERLTKMSAEFAGTTEAALEGIGIAARRGNTFAEKKINIDNAIARAHRAFDAVPTQGKNTARYMKDKFDALIIETAWRSIKASIADAATRHTKKKKLQWLLKAHLIERYFGSKGDDDDDNNSDDDELGPRDGDDDSSSSDDEKHRLSSKNQRLLDTAIKAAESELDPLMANLLPQLGVNKLKKPKK